ncbi:hypothetical protein [Flavobacterium wongokense]|uniref:hypothetical protein n=1 Tax=Flavobacterium wongokense TaxID=2910674 RepID=UPI001F1BBB98|nr:hypothetical protein [Flavobacterium sp. WG47]MCF6133249.1 hypothetical protein [Flavobacterium sp. WG47]
MRGFNSCFFILLGFVLFSCKNDKDAKTKDDSAIRYRYYNLQNRGWKSLTHSQKVDNINFTATEVPIVYYLLKDNKDDDLIKVDSLYEENKRDRIVEFEFQDQDEEDLLLEKFTNLDYQKGVEYMSFTIQDDFSVVTSKKDTIPCSGVIFERNFKIAPYHKLMLFFSGINPNDKIQLIYKDNLFRKGTLKFRFKEPILNL